MYPTRVRRIGDGEFGLAQRGRALVEWARLPHVHYFNDTYSWSG